MGKQVRFLEGAGHSLIDSTTVPKNRKPKFELIFKIIDLNNVPLVSGSAYVKWHLPHSTSTEHRGKTARAPIKDHKVVWDYEKTLQFRITADKNGHLHDAEMQLEVLQEYNAGGRTGADRIVLGVVRLNLAEYVDARHDGEDGVVRRYLMQESKINSTLKLAVLMNQTEGDKSFTAPALKTASIFGGIAGILSVEQAEQDDGKLPSSRKAARETGELQDLYRRALTASYTSNDLELPADECIEDIFAGGDGWGRKMNRVTFQARIEPESDEESVSPKRRISGHSRNASHDQSRGIDHRRGSSRSMKAGKFQDRQNSSSSDDHKKLERLRDHDVSEFDLREDLRSWHISTT